MALRKIIASRYSWTETVDGVTRYYVGNLGDNWDFAAGEITKGEAEGALGASDAAAADLTGQVVDHFSTVQADHVADVAALTSAAPNAITSAAPAALTAAAAVGANPTKAEFDLLLADVTALRTTLAASVVDVTALRATVAALRVDLVAVRTTLAATKAALETPGGPMAAS